MDENLARLIQSCYLNKGEYGWEELAVAWTGGFLVVFCICATVLACVYLNKD